MLRRSLPVDIAAGCEAGQMSQHSYSMIEKSHACIRLRAARECLACLDSLIFDLYENSWTEEWIRRDGAR